MPPVTEMRQLRGAVLYTRGKAMGGEARDDELIVNAFRQHGVEGESVDLAHLTQLPTGQFLLRDAQTGAQRLWQPPNVALMYHGALSTPNTGPLLDALEGAGTKVINNRPAWETMTDKWLFYKQMRDHAVPTIPTREVRTQAEGLAAFADYGRPAVFKKPVSTEGDDVYILSKDADLAQQVTGRIAELDGRVIAQPFVESQIGHNLEPAIMARISESGEPTIGMRNDFRIMTVRGIDGKAEVIASFHRIAKDPKQTVNNVAKGSRAVRLEFNELHSADQETVTKAVSAMPQGQVVGWDLIGQPGQRVIMEANSGPGLPTASEGFRVNEVLAPYARLARALAEQSRASHTG